MKTITEWTVDVAEVCGGYSGRYKHMGKLVEAIRTEALEAAIAAATAVFEGSGVIYNEGLENAIAAIEALKETP